jgi:hypothetical protein
MACQLPVVSWAISMPIEMGQLKWGNPADRLIWLVLRVLSPQPPIFSAFFNWFNPRMRYYTLFNKNMHGFNAKMGKTGSIRWAQWGNTNIFIRIDTFCHHNGQYKNFFAFFDRNSPSWAIMNGKGAMHPIGWITPFWGETWILLELGGNWLLRRDNRSKCAYRMNRGVKTPFYWWPWWNAHRFWIHRCNRIHHGIFYCRDCIHIG